jgi:hypothetical protein
MPSLVGSATPLHKQLPRGETTAEITRFMYWSDIQSLYNTDNLLCFVDAVDRLIEDGWKVVSTSEKRKAGTAGLDNNSDPFVTKNFTKKIFGDKWVRIIIDCIEIPTIKYMNGQCSIHCPFMYFIVGISM